MSDLQEWGSSLLHLLFRWQELFRLWKLSLSVAVKAEIDESSLALPIFCNLVLFKMFYYSII